MSKDCGNHGHRRHKTFRRILVCLLALAVLVLVVVFVVWLVLRPAKPKFYLQDATVLSFNRPGDPSNRVTATLQVTISARNPNDRIGIYYDKLDVYAAYRSQQITLATAIPPSYQGHGDAVIWSPFLYGANVPLAPYLAAALAQDQSAGVTLLHVKLDGRLRWKVGSWTSGRYRLFITCPAVLTFDGARGGGTFYSPVIRFRQVATCTVDV